MIKAVIFDFYGVFYPDPYNAWLGANHLKREGEYYQASRDQDTGKITKEQFLDRLSKLSGREITRTEFNGSSEIDGEVVEIARALKSKYKIALLSNTSSESLNSKLEKYEIIDIFDEIVASSDTGMAKPDRGIFEYTLEKLGIEPNEAIFIDDNKDFANAASVIGINGIQFTSAAKLLEDLDLIIA